LHGGHLGLFYGLTLLVTEYRAELQRRHSIIAGEAKSSFKPRVDRIDLPMLLTDWSLVEVALLLIGLTKIS